jgi:hypothetical protein
MIVVPTAALTGAYGRLGWAIAEEGVGPSWRGRDCAGFSFSCTFADEAFFASLLTMVVVPAAALGVGAWLAWSRWLRPERPETDADPVLTSNG